MRLDLPRLKYVSNILHRRAQVKAVNLFVELTKITECDAGAKAYFQNSLTWRALRQTQLNPPTIHFTDNRPEIEPKWVITIHTGIFTVR